MRNYILMLPEGIMNIGGLIQNLFGQLSLLLFFFDEIKIHTSDPSFFIFNVITHIATAFCNLTGFCNGFRRTWFSFQIQVYSLILVFQKFIFQTFTGFFLSFT